MDPVTIIGMAALGSALAVTRSGPDKPRIHPVILPEVVRRLGLHWRNFNLVRCVCNAPSWQQPCPWCDYYAPHDYGKRYKRSGWLKQAGPLWLPDQLIKHARKMSSVPWGDVRFMEDAMHWFDWPTPEQVWDVWAMPQQYLPPYRYDPSMSDAELHEMASKINKNFDFNDINLVYNVRHRLSGPGDLASIRERWTPEYKASMRAYLSDEPTRVIWRLLNL